MKALTQREIEVAKLLVDGLHDKEIADKLCISWQTVKNYVYAIKTKLGANSRTGAALGAVRNGYVKVDVPIMVIESMQCPYCHCVLSVSLSRSTCEATKL
jgi:DNA-binding CsgD family transcriptional regulator